MLNCHSNRLSSLDVSGLTKLTQLYCNHNKLPFSSLAKGLNIGTYTYKPQDSIFIARSVAGNITIDYSAEALINGQATNFVFYKNNEQVAANNTGLYTTTGVGDYYCKMTNSLFSGLTLTTARISILQGLTVSPSAINMRTASDTAIFTITSNTDWNVVSSEAWLTVSVASGSNNGNVTLTAIANPSNTARTATVTISGAGVAPQTVTVTQVGPALVLLVSSSTLNVNSNNSTATFTITSNTNWNVVSSEAWLTVSAASGSNNDIITLTATENPGITARTATVTISGTGVVSQTITVTQAANNATAVGELSYSGSCVYPNPVKDMINVRLATKDLPATICIFNMEGALLKLIKANTTITHIDMENYKAGTYVIKIIMPTQIMTKKILKLQE
jgi:hypothetical protein